MNAAGAPIAVDDLASDPDFGWVTRILVAAKKNLEQIKDGDFLAVFFMVKDRELAIIAIESLASEVEKDSVAQFLRKTVAESDPDACAFLSDTWTYVITDEADRARVAADPRWWAGLTTEEKVKIAVRKEALSINAETRTRQAIFVQAYRRPGRRMVAFDELTVYESPPGPSTGRFQGLLSRAQQ